MDEMRSLTIFAILVLIAVPFVNGIIGKRYWQMRRDVETARNQRLEELFQASNAPAEPKTVFLEQPLDHFNAMSKVLGKVFKQRLFISEQYWDPSNPYTVFLYIGGEGTLNGKALMYGEINDMAKASNYGALLVAAEHRFYGASINDDGLQLGQLQYLSSQQALADLENVVRYINKIYNLDDTVHWISFGGSYSGALSAWMRLKYPHLIQGAVASSAPLRAVTDFQGYNDVVAASLATTLVGGSQECLDSVRKAFAMVDELITQGQYSKLQEDFKSCGAVSETMDTVMFVSNLAGLFQLVVQYNNEIPGRNISHACKAMTFMKDPYQNLAALNAEVLKEGGEECVDNSYQNYTSMMMNSTVNRTAVGPGMRQWIYQTCTQFGYYQTCEAGTNCPFSHLLSLRNSDLGICQNVFKIDPSQVENNVKFTDDYYGSNRTQQSRIIFVNGSIDPWHVLSILTNQTAYGEFGVFIQGTAHCADLIPWKNPTYALEMAREQIASLVGQFLQEPVVRQYK